MNVEFLLCRFPVFLVSLYTWSMEASELNLSIVSLQNVLLHEEIETKRVNKLVERLRTDRILKNPPMVAEVRDNGTPRYVVLDGASRSSALRVLNVRDMLVQ